MRRDVRRRHALTVAVALTLTVAVAVAAAHPASAKMVNEFSVLGFSGFQVFGKEDLWFSRTRDPLRCHAMSWMTSIPVVEPAAPVVEPAARVVEPAAAVSGLMQLMRETRRFPTRSVYSAAACAECTETGESLHRCRHRLH